MDPASLWADMAAALVDTQSYWRAMLHFFRGGAYDVDDRALINLSVPGRVHCFARALHAMMWATPHYRCASWREDMRNNLKNVVLPGVGVPLSVLCFSRAAATAFLVLGIPTYSLAAALFNAPRDSFDSWPTFVGAARAKIKVTLHLYRKYLLEPSDWFSIWRLNCSLAALHAYITADVGYQMEDKWVFLKEATQAGIPVTPWWDRARRKAPEYGRRIGDPHVCKRTLWRRLYHPTKT